MKATDLPKPPRPRYPWRIPLLAAVTMPLLAVGGWVGICMIDRLRASWEVQAAVAEIDATDPGWTLDEILARRKSIPDAQNGALRVATIKALLPKGVPVEEQPAIPWHGEADDAEVLEESRQKAEEEVMQLQDSITALDPRIALDAKQLAYLRARHKKADAAFREALKLADFPRGRYTIDWLPNPVNASTEPAQASREVVGLLEDEARLLAHDKDLREACRCVRAMLQIGQYAGGEPGVILYLIRVAELSIGAFSLERIVGQGQPDPADLLALQRLLEAIDKEELVLLRAALHSERALVHRAMQAYDRGEIESLMDRRPGEKPSTWDRLKESLLDVPVTRHAHAAYLRLMTGWLGQCGRPLNEQAKLANQCDQDALKDKKAALAYLLLPGTRTSEASFRLRAYLRCAIGIAAVERYRQEKGGWPASLAALVPGHLKEVPADPYDGKPLRLKRLADGVVVYSVGPDLTDNGGTLNRQQPDAVGSDLGFRLWDVGKRGRLPGSK